MKTDEVLREVEAIPVGEGATSGQILVDGLVVLLGDPHMNLGSIRVVVVGRDHLPITSLLGLSIVIIKRREETMQGTGEGA